MTARVTCSECGRRRVKFMITSEVSTFGNRPLCNKCANALWKAEARCEAQEDSSVSRIRGVVF